MAARAPETTEIPNSLCQWRGTPQKAERIHALRGVWGQEEEGVKYTDFMTAVHAWSMGSSKHSKHATGSQAHCPLAKTSEVN